MAGIDELLLHVHAHPGEDNEELAALARRLRTSLLDLDVDSVDPLAEAVEPDGAKGAGVLIGWLTVRLGTAETLRTVIAAVFSWAARSGHTVEVSYGEDRLMVKGVTSAQQERIIDEFIARHSVNS